MAKGLRKRRGGKNKIWRRRIAEGNVPATLGENNMEQKRGEQAMGAENWGTTATLGSSFLGALTAKTRREKRE